LTAVVSFTTSFQSLFTTNIISFLAKKRKG